MTPKKAFIGMMILLATVIGTGGGLFYLIDTQLSAKAEHINALKTEVDILDLKIQNSQAAALELEKYRDIATILDDVLPPEKIQNDIVAEILDISSRNNAAIEEITFPSSDGIALDFTTSQTQPVDGVPGVLATTIQLNVSATFEDTLRLLDDFGQNQRKMQVASVSITPVKDTAGNATGRYSLNISINAYQRA